MIGGLHTVRCYKSFSFVQYVSILFYPASFVVGRLWVKENEKYLVTPTSQMWLSTEVVDATTIARSD